MEKLFKEYEQVNPDTKYRMIRYGNVFGSTGSVITKWKPLIEQGKEVIITNPNATRFFGTNKEVVEFILKSKTSEDSTPEIPIMKAISMGNMLKACQKVYGDCPVKEIGLQKGENMHETMDGKIYSNEVEQFTIDEFIENFL
jgi:UDP-N-acetylglucosamine 4,6-dehydratase/UDP-glucose 4-epimerase